MNRRTFLQLGAVGAALGYSTSRALAHNPLKYPITSTPDLGTTLDETRAAKARTLAEYVITKDEKELGLISHNPNATNGSRDYQGVEAVLVVDGQRYSVWVANKNENDPKQKRPKSMVIYARPEGTEERNFLTELSDHGLDGRCDYGRLYPKASGTGKIIDFSDGTGGILAEGLEHRDRFQSLYETTLDKLIGFYERQMKK